MAKLVLTEEEKKAENYLQWDNETLGKLVKHIASTIKDARTDDVVSGVSDGMLLINMAIASNADEANIEMKGVTVSGEHKGDWMISVKRTNTQE